jgi:hypothetical membrane protein
VRTLDWRRLGGFAALLAPLLMWIEFFAVAPSRQGYDLLTRPFSDLATRGAPWSSVFDLGFFLVPGLLCVLVGIGLWFVIEGGRAWRLGAVLVVAAGVFLFATGIFRQDPSSSYAASLHGTVSQICFALASVAPLVLFFGSGGNLHLSPPRRIWLAAGIVAFAVEGLAVALRHLLHFPEGLFQRPFTLSLTIWFVATGAWMLKVRQIEGLTVPS